MVLGDAERTFVPGLRGTQLARGPKNPPDLGQGVGREGLLQGSVRWWLFCDVNQFSLVAQVTARWGCKDELTTDFTMVYRNMICYDAAQIL